MKNIHLRCLCSKKPELTKCEDGYLCSNKECFHSQSANAFPVINGVPVIISEIQTDTVCSLEYGKSYVERPFSELSTLKKLILGESKVTKKNCNSFVNLVSKSAERAKVLVIGGGEKGSGTSKLWNTKNIEIISIDIYGRTQQI